MKSHTVLLIEDSLDQLEFLSTLLESKNFLVLKAENHREAMGFLNDREIKIDVIISDQHMPEKTGIQILSELRALGFTMPVFILTSDETISKDHVIKLGATDVFYKPTEVSSLLQVVTSLLTQR